MTENQIPDWTCLVFLLDKNKIIVIVVFKFHTQTVYKKDKIVYFNKRFREVGTQRTHFKFIIYSLY